MGSDKFIYLYQNEIHKQKIKEKRTILKTKSRLTRNPLTRKFLKARTNISNQFQNANKDQRSK
jgi:hypothetical protein